MILWDKSEKEFNKSKENFKRYDFIYVLCESCGSERLIKYVTWKNQIRITGNDNCSSCKSK
jgi:superfamily II helicase